MKWQRFLRPLPAAVWVLVTTIMTACGGDAEQPSGSKTTWDVPAVETLLQLVPQGADTFTFVDLSSVRDERLNDIQDQIEDLVDSDQLDDWEIDLDDIDSLILADTGTEDALLLMKGFVSVEDVGDALDEARFRDDLYRGVTVWSNRGNVSVALVGDGVVAIGVEERIEDALDSLIDGTRSMQQDEEVTSIHKSLGETVVYSVLDDCDYRGCRKAATGIRSGDGDLIATFAFAFRNDDTASDAERDIEDDVEDLVDDPTVAIDGSIVTAASPIEEDEFRIDRSGVLAYDLIEYEEPEAPAVRAVEAPAPTAAPAIPAPTVRAAPVAQRPASAPTARPTRVVATPAPAPTAQPTQVVATPAPVPTSAPTQVVATPAPAPTATRVPTPTAPAAPQLSGHLTIAVPYVGSFNGLPASCSFYCAGTMYMSGLTNTLLTSGADPHGNVWAEPMLAQSWEVAASLAYTEFNLRSDVQFQHGSGPMTAQDVEFSFNNANSRINPESIHRHNAEFASLFRSVESIEDHTIRVNYNDYDSRNILRNMSSFYRTAGIVSKSVYDAYGADRMEGVCVGVGAFMAASADCSSAWVSGQQIELVANPDYYGTDMGLGPFVERIRWIEAPESAMRIAMLQTEEADIVQFPVGDYPRLESDGFQFQKKGLLGRSWDVSFAGNYWESHSAVTGEPLQRVRDIGRPWIGDPFENGPAYSDNTGSMVGSQWVRNALAHSIDRRGLVEDILGGVGFVNHQPYLSVNSTRHHDGLYWHYDPDTARQMMAEAGYPDGFEMELWVRDRDQDVLVGEVIIADWAESAGVAVNLVVSLYSSYRPGLVSRTVTTPGVDTCGGDGLNFPHRWAKGYYMSSHSDGGYGVGQELPYAAEMYSAMIGEPYVDVLDEYAARFFNENRKWANCVGLFEEPIWPAYNPDRIAEWDMRPTANTDLGTINNVRSIKLR